MVRNGAHHGETWFWGRVKTPELGTVETMIHFWSYQVWGMKAQGCGGSLSAERGPDMHRGCAPAERLLLLRL